MQKKLKAPVEIALKVPFLIVESAKFTGKALLAPIPTGYCITKNSFFTSVEQSKSMIHSIQECINTVTGKTNDNGAHN